MIYTQLTTKDGDMLDALCWRHYGRHDVLPVVLEANTGLASLPPVLPAGLVINLPDIHLPDDAPVIRLWS